MSEQSEMLHFRQIKQLLVVVTPLAETAAITLQGLVSDTDKAHFYTYIGEFPLRVTFK
jgi:hypothetical protein